jgi:flavin reductase (DIM6/NTAB) family NADH-FMN oxidoreductase RutF
MKGEQEMKAVNEMEIAQRAVELIKGGAFLVVQAKGRKNVMTIGWAMFGYVWGKSVMMIAVRNSRFTHGIIEEADSFTVSVPTGKMQKEINSCGSKSGKDLDKFKEFQLATTKAQKVSAPVLKIPGYHYECKMIYKTPMDPKFMDKEMEALYPKKDYHTLYFGEIVACYIGE